MVGLTNTNLKEGANCYIVVYTPFLDGEVTEFLEGTVTKMGRLITPESVPPTHTMRRYFEQLPPLISQVEAKVTDVGVGKGRDPIDPILLHQEPFRHYLVVPPQDYVRNLITALEGKEHTIQTLEGLLRSPSLYKEAPYGKGNILSRLLKSFWKA